MGTYDWRQHMKPATIEGRAVEGGGGPGGGGLPTLSPQGFIKINTGVSFVIDSLSYFENEEALYIYDLLMWIRELDDEWPFLTRYNRNGLLDALKVVQPSPAPSLETE